MINRYIGSFIISLVISVVAVGAAAVYLRSDISYTGLEVARLRGDSIAHIVQTVRRWNAMHGGVYVVTTDTTPPNPYLDVPDRDIIDSYNRALTKVNPAYMTRQISEILAGSQIEAGLTSLRPLNPVNMPDDWERKILNRFEEGDGDTAVELQGDVYRYLAPLKVKPECLGCHQKYGYELGDVRGGLSIQFPVNQIESLLGGIISRSQYLFYFAFCTLFVTIFISLSLFNYFSLRLASSRKQEEKLLHQASHDGLTGVFNRRGIESLAAVEFINSVEKATPFSVMMIDVDHFKRVNDLYGHSVGDQVLICVAREMTDLLREFDQLGRYGGEEFIVLLPGVGATKAGKIAERIRETIRAVQIDVESGVSESSLKVTISIGVAERERGNFEQLDELIDSADQAMYAAKHRGRDRVVVAE